MRWKESQGQNEVRSRQIDFMRVLSLSLHSTVSLESGCHGDDNLDVFSTEAVL